MTEGTGANGAETDRGSPPGSQRELILARFAGWLDEALGEERPPAGIAAELLQDSVRAEDECDLFALWSAQTALAQEVKLQGRTFHELREAVGGLPEAMDELRAANERVLGAERASREERAFASVLELLLDLRERLRRGRDAAGAYVRTLDAAPRPGLLARLAGTPGPRSRDAEQAFVRGYELALERLDESLKEHGVEEIPCAGRPFDPRTMKAVEVATDPGVAPGTVLDVHRSGYRRHGEVLRAAEVKVVRDKASERGLGVEGGSA